MQSNRFWQGVRRAYARYDRLMEKQGFYIVLGVCVLMIVGSALYTFYWRDQWEEPPMGATVTDQALTAGGNQQAQTLAEALVQSQGASQAFTPATEPPFSFRQPVAGFTGRSFDLAEPQYFPQASVWQVHAGVDIFAEYGTPVKACERGTVAEVWQDNERGLCVRITHAYGYQSLYTGLSDASYVAAGDPVSQGQTIGHVGNGVLIESDEEPHLHLEIWKDGRPVDPLGAFLGIDSGSE